MNDQAREYMRILLKVMKIDEKDLKGRKRNVALVPVPVETNEMGK